MTLLSSCWRFSPLIGCLQVSSLLFFNQPSGSTGCWACWWSTYIKLVGGLEHMDYFSIYWECHHPNWRSPSFFRGVGFPPTSISRNSAGWNPGPSPACLKGPAVMQYHATMVFFVDIVLATCLPWSYMSLDCVSTSWLVNFSPVHFMWISTSSLTLRYKKWSFNMFQRFFFLLAGHFQWTFVARLLLLPYAIPQPFSSTGDGVLDCIYPMVI